MFERMSEPLSPAQQRFSMGDRPPLFGCVRALDPAEGRAIGPLLDAREAGLNYAATDAPGFTRRRSGKGFSYRDTEERRIADRPVLRRIRALAVPPAWRNVWICPDPNGHIQAMGVDDKGRRQYRYHPRFRDLREGAKYEHMLDFAEALPRLRERVTADMTAPGFGRRQVLATLVSLLETTMIRVGNRAYARQNQSYGLTTLEGQHVEIEGARVKFNFKGKSGKIWKLDIRDRRIVRILKTCQELPGQTLFQYVDAEGAPQGVTSADVNAYLREVSGSDVTAKDFRTWNGSVLAATALAEIGSEPRKTYAKRNLTRAIERVAARLGNTPAICRKCYVHPDIVSAYLDGELTLDLTGADDQADPSRLRPEEAAVLAFLRARSQREDGVLAA
jgi:DNA topoisomerase-1